MNKRIKTAGRYGTPGVIEVGDDVLILHKAGKGTTGTVTRINVAVPWATGPTGVMVARHDGSGSGIYDRSDLALVD